MASLLYALTLIAAAADADDGTAGWLARLREQAPRAWGEYYARSKRLQGSWSAVGHRGNSNKVTRIDRGEFKQRDGCFLAVGRHPMETNSETVSAINPRYQFSLVRGSTDKDWVIDGVGNKLFKPLGVDIKSPEFAISHFLRFPFTFEAVGYQGISITDPEFTLTNATEVSEQERQLVRVEFTCAAREEPHWYGLEVSAGWVLLDPEHYWVIRKADLETRALEGEGKYAPGTETVDFEYKETEDGFPITTRVDSHRRIPGEDVDVRITCEFDLEERDVPEDEFTLSAFGFPEPGGQTMPGKSSPWALWISVAGGLVFGLGAFFFWRSKRGKAPQVT